MSRVIPLAALLAAGCGSNDHTLSGRVHFPDGSPLTHGQVVVESAAAKAGGAAAVGPDGAFAVHHLPAGEYAVYVNRAFVPGSTPDPGAAVKPFEAAPPGLLVAPKFTSPEASGLTAAVPAPGPVDLVVEKPDGKAARR